MSPLILPATALTPAIDFDYAERRLSIRGESYPEDVSRFYHALFASLREYLALAVRERHEITVTLHLTYVNSASIKSLQQLLSMLNAATQQGANVTVHWMIDPQDETMEELGQDLLADKPWLTYEIRPLDARTAGPGAASLARAGS